MHPPAVLTCWCPVPSCLCRYGEKIVKGSPCPRSYYKCSQQNCTAKKIVERDNNTGLVTGTEYKVRSSSIGSSSRSQQQQPTATDIVPLVAAACTKLAVAPKGAECVALFLHYAEV